MRSEKFDDDDDDDDNNNNSLIIIDMKWDLGLTNDTNFIDYLTPNLEMVIVRKIYRTICGTKPSYHTLRCHLSRNMEEITAEINQSLVRNTRLRSDSLHAAIPHMNQSANYWTESIHLYISTFVSSVT